MPRCSARNADGGATLESMKRTLFLASSTAVLALLALTGCVPDAPTPSTITPPTTTEPPTTTPTTEPAPEELTLADLVASATGLGDLQIGGNAQALADSTGVIVWAPEYCVRPDGETTEAEPGRWIPNFESAESFYGDRATPFFIDAQGGTINRIDITTTEISDAKGIHVGSTRDEFLAAYPGTAMSYDGPISDVYVLTAAGGNVVYEITRHDEGVPYWPADQQNKVFQIRILVAGMDPDFATAASGNIAGVCSGI